MKVSIKWLKTMVDVPLDLREFAHRLDMTGTVVESVEVVGEAFDNIVIGQILTKEKHPDADTLWLTTVDVGSYNLGENGVPTPLQIVCGAQNFVAGDKVPVALVGAVLPGGMEIKKARVRGIYSCGMNCSARELGLGTDHDGIMILDADAPVGLSFAEYLDATDTIIDLEITPNRPDCLSMLGIAREVGAIYDKPFSMGRAIPGPAVGESVAGEPAVGELVAGGPVASESVAAGPLASEQVEDLVRVTIDDATRCPRYVARVIKGVKIGPSPDWLVERVTAAGARSINNIVDATNYIMFELGQPLHAFDLDTLAKDTEGKAHIVVRAATDSERFTTLDGIERTLDSDITCIVDGNAADGAGATIALAGVMGGLDSEITESTVNILLESATFSTAHTSRTSRKLQLFSEASARFQRGVDGATCDEFCARAAALMVEVAGGVVCEGAIDAYPAPVQMPELLVRTRRLCDFMGAEIAVSDMRGILERLGCTVQAQGADLLVVPPTYRPDLTREIDLYEEILRIWGMNRVTSTLPGGRERIGERTIEQQRLEVVGRALRACGLNETMTYVFVSPDDNEIVQMAFGENQQAVELINPMSSDQNLMRRTILPGLLRSVVYNQNHGVSNVHLYETGVVFYAAEGKKLPREKQMLAAVLAGSWNEKGWNDLVVPLDFFDGKGVVENLLRELNITKLRLKPLSGDETPWLQPGRAAKVLAGSTDLGWIGEIHPRVCAAFGIVGSVVAFELDLKALLSAAEQARPYKDVPQYPAVDLDLAIVVNEDVTTEKLMQVITSAGGTLLDELRLFDVYRDERRIGVGKKSMAFALSYRAPDRTLTFDEVEKLHQKVIGKLVGATGGEVRS